MQKWKQYYLEYKKESVIKIIIVSLFILYYVAYMVGRIKIMNPDFFSYYEKMGYDKYEVFNVFKIWYPGYSFVCFSASFMHYITNKCGLSFSCINALKDSLLSFFAVCGIVGISYMLFSNIEILWLGIFFLSIFLVPFISPVVTTYLLKKEKEREKQ